MSDKHLERKEVLNLVYTQQADRMADAYARLMADFSQTTAWGRGLESDLSWARSELMQVKAEVELWKLRSDNWQKFCQLTRPEMTDELNRLKAEVERLTERLGGVRLIVTEEMYDELNTKYLEQQHELQNIALTARQILDEKIDLKEQVERLTKAGDAMDAYLKRQDGTTNGMLDCRRLWHAAKEGKPHA
jgi:arginyl-tRNA synthetase